MQNESREDERAEVPGEYQDGITVDRKPTARVLVMEGWGFPGGSVVKHPPANAGDTGDVGSIPRSGRSLVGGNGSPHQYSSLENSMDRGAWWATVHGVTKSWTQLSPHGHC